MTRGTTPDIVMELDGVNLDELTAAFVTLQQGEIILEKTLDDMTIGDDALHLTLTQEETLEFEAGTEVQIQMRGVLNGVRAFATNISRLSVYPILKEGVIE